MLIADGRNIVQVARCLGHHSPGFTLQVYAPLMDDGMGEPLDLHALFAARAAGNTGGNASHGNGLADTPHGAVEDLAELAP